MARDIHTDSPLNYTYFGPHLVGMSDLQKCQTFKCNLSRAVRFGPKVSPKLENSLNASDHI